MGKHFLIKTFLKSEFNEKKTLGRQILNQNNFGNWADGGENKFGNWAGKPIFVMADWRNPQNQKKGITGLINKRESMDDQWIKSNKPNSLKIKNRNS